MMISSKGRYALRVMVFLAEHNSDEYVPLKEISEKEQISQKYLESIARMLSKEHLIEDTAEVTGWQENRKITGLVKY